MSKILVDTIDTRSGTTTLTLGSTNAGTIALGSGDVQSNFNDPTFLLKPTSAQSFSNNTYTKVAFDTAVVDSDSGFDNSNDRWTVPTGKGGKYLITFQMMYADAADFFVNVHYRINGNTNSGFSTWGDNTYYTGFNQASIINLSAGDYIELWSKQASGGSINSYFSDQGVTIFLGGHRIGS